ncbi:MAG: ATP synthase F1 subunit gamma [Acidobacteriota bacterium]
MANRRVLVKRRKSVKNIRKITRTMQLIATARFQATHDRALASRPYSDKLGELVADLSRAAGDVDHPLMRTGGDAGRSELVVLTSNRGLCGGYNANVLRRAIDFSDGLSADHKVDVDMVGKKGIAYFRFLDRGLDRTYVDFSEDPKFEEVEPLANDLMRRFEEGEVDSVHVAYMRFESTSRQTPTVLQLLPLEPLDAEPAADSTEETTGATASEYEFSPSPEELLDALLPASVRMRLFQCFLDATVSEHVARMVAMKAATDAAGDMIKSLTRQYNRARQTHITMELLDILGGVNALE